MLRCEADPVRPCKQCRESKARCDLMPVNIVTGKTDRHQLSEAEILEYRISLCENKERQSGKGETVRNPPNEGLTTLPSGTLAPLETLTLQSASSTGDTPAESPAGSVMDCPAPAPPSLLLSPPLPHPSSLRHISCRSPLPATR
ncbi:hypothetical protein BJV77DRAFT_636326 [Russula vinacea]|nr:hypothetical protein BJV77DRAFT_636326 [Russula vinacea]